MKISFKSDVNDPALNESRDDYERYWERDGVRTIAVMEKVSGLRFKAKHLKATIIRGTVSHSEPLQLVSQHPRLLGRTLTHELGHILLDDNKIEVVVPKDGNLSFGNHKLLDLILFDIWVELEGKEIALRRLEFEKRVNREYYSRAWDWALSMGKDERQKLFSKIASTKKFKTSG